MEVYTKMNKMEIRKGDLVEIICGGIEAKGKRGKVLAASPKNGTVVVEGLNMVKRHTRPRSAQQPGGIIEKPRAIDVSNVMIVCPACDKTTRIGHVAGENGKYLRKRLQNDALCAIMKEIAPVWV